MVALDESTGTAVRSLLGGGGTTSTHRTVAKKVDKPVTEVKTGILQSYSGGSAQVAIEGNVLTLPVLDSVAAAIAVGSTVVCQVKGKTGYVLGSVGTVSRTASATWTGGYSNPPVPRPGLQGVTYTTYAPKSYSTYSGGSWAQVTNQLVQGSGKTSAWFYGANAFSGLAGKTIKTVEVYVSALVNTADSYPLNFYTHANGSKPSGALTLTSSSQTVLISGWVPLPSSWFAAFQNGTAGLAISGNPAASISTKSPFGTIRIGWTN